MAIKKILCKNENEFDCFFTPWSIVHFYSGYFLMLACQTFGLSYFHSFLVSNIIHLIYEIKDYYITYHVRSAQTPRSYQVDWNYNTLFNSIGDQLSCILGMLLYIFIRETYDIPEVSYGTLLIYSILYIILVLLFYFLITKRFNHG